MDCLGLRHLRVFVVGFVVLCVTSCSGGAGSGTGGSGISALNLAGTWTITAVSTQGHGTVSGTATVMQSGTGLGLNGTTTLAGLPGQIVVAQNGTGLAGTISGVPATNSAGFTGTLSSGSFTVSGSSSCGTINRKTILALVGTATSTTVQGTYTETVGACLSALIYYSDAGTFTGTKH